eukprot:gene31620-41053_t
MEFERELRELGRNRSNVHFAKDVQIVPLTGSDYPKTVPIFEEDPVLISSIKNTELERGKPLGAVVSEFRSMNFGPPLFCNGKSSFYHLDNRQNKPMRSMIRSSRHLPSTTAGGFGRMNSLEGKKYWHFFKHMLLGSEEHYYTHTHFLTLNEWEIIEGFAKRGMMFPRKFSNKKTAALVDKIDEMFLLNKSTEAGNYWPGFFDVDVSLRKKNKAKPGGDKPRRAKKGSSAITRRKLMYV